ncbi:MAG TPA: hypothetical protein VI322_02030 [Candidatus Saccharimonadia bacterium]
MTQPTSELAWLLADYRAAGVDAPARVVAHPDMSEGELMSDEEIEEFIKDSVATLRILSDKQSAQFDRVAGIFRADMAYLVTLGRLEEDEYNDLTNTTNLRF